MYFVDAWAFIALIDRHDSDHRAASRALRRVEGIPLITHDGVFAEVLAYFSEEGPYMRAQAITAVRSALKEMTVVPWGRPLFLRALDRYAARPDKEYSLTDCFSMLIMEDHGIDHVLTNDHHFRQEGFVVVNE
jgi:predicted nucleic acid-binding protein